jgi:hypothetical protein
MKLTKKQLKQIIKEELNSVLKENYEQHPLYLKIVEIGEVASDMPDDADVEDKLDNFIDYESEAEDNEWAKMISLAENNPTEIATIAKNWIDKVYGDDEARDLEAKNAEDKDNPMGW